MTSIEYVRAMEEQITQLRLQVKGLETERDSLDKALQLERQDRQRALELAATDRKKWEEEHNNWRQSFEKQRDQQVSVTVHNLLVDRVSKIELAMVALPSTDAVHALATALDKRVTDVEGAVRDRTSKTSGMTSVWFGVVGVVGLLAGVGALIAFVVNMLGKG